MADDVEFTGCQNCGANCYVVWVSQGMGRPQFCPFCGKPMDYDPPQPNETQVEMK